MLDSDLAEIYGITTKRINEQVKRNILKFDEDFMFILTKDEVISVRSQNATSRSSALFKGQDGGTRYLPKVFTEQGVYMLMTILNTSEAIEQSKTLIRLFKSMKDNYYENKNLLSNKNIEQRTELLEHNVLNNTKDNNKCHVRFIVIDFNTRNETIYHCGASLKDAGNKITTITKLSSTKEYHSTINKLLKNNPISFT